MAAHPGTESRRAPWTDIGLVVVVLVIVTGWHATELGFYSDDWNLLSIFGLSADQSLSGLYHALDAQAHMRMRPGQKLLAALLYWAFGFRPLGYHLAIAGFLTAAAVLMLLSLRELGVSRGVSVAAAILYSTLPHYSTARVWFANVQAPFSMATYFLSLYAGLRSLRSSGATAPAWRLVSLVSLVASTLSYEVALPLFLVNPFLFSQQVRRSPDGAALSRSIPRVFLGATVTLVFAVAAFKAATSTRLSSGPSLFYLTFSAKHLACIYLWVYGVAAPRTVWIAASRAAPMTLALAAALALAIFEYLRRLAPVSFTNGGRWSYGRLAAGGLGLFALGHVVFLATSQGFSAAGPNNRTAIAGTVGIALVGVAAAGRLAEWAPRRWLAHSFAGLIAAASVSGVLVNEMLVSSWVMAYQGQRQVLDAIRRHVNTLAPGSTLILDGVCPYVGPAIVFESSWDLRGALRLFYRDSTLRADVLTPDLRVEHDGLHTTIYGEEETYPYGQLAMFNAQAGATHPLPDERSARSYFARFHPNASDSCPPGRPGHGVRVF